MLLVEAALWYDKAPLGSGVSTIFPSFAHNCVSASGAQEFLLGAIAIYVSFQSWFKSCFSGLLTFFPSSSSALSTLTPRHVPSRPLVTMSTTMHWRNYIAEAQIYQLCWYLFSAHSTHCHRFNNISFLGSISAVHWVGITFCQCTCNHYDYCWKYKHGRIMRIGITSVRGSSQTCSASSLMKADSILGGGGTAGIEFPSVSGAVMEDRKSQHPSSVITSPHNSASCIHVKVSLNSALILHPVTTKQWLTYFEKEMHEHCRWLWIEREKLRKVRECSGTGGVAPVGTYNW